MCPSPPRPTIPIFRPALTFAWRSGEYVVIPAHSSGAASVFPKLSPSKARRDGTFHNCLSALLGHRCSEHAASRSVLSGPSPRSSPVPCPTDSHCVPSVAGCVRRLIAVLLLPSAGSSIAALPGAPTPLLLGAASRPSRPSAISFAPLGSPPQPFLPAASRLVATQFDMVSSLATLLFLGK